MDPYKDNMLFQIIEGLVCASCHKEIQATMADLESCDWVCCDLCSKRFRTIGYKRRLIVADNAYNKGKSSNKI